MKHQAGDRADHCRVKCRTKTSGANSYSCLDRLICHFAGRHAIYVEAEGPPASPQPQAWPVLAKALAPGGPLEVGAPIRIDLAEVGSFDGAVDYLTPNYVGIRTADALIRFHGRSSLGMTVAVGHHHYSSSLDAEATKMAWESSLAGAFSAAGA